MEEDAKHHAMASSPVMVSRATHRRGWHHLCQVCGNLGDHNVEQTDIKGFLVIPEGISQVQMVRCLIRLSRVGVGQSSAFAAEQQISVHKWSVAAGNLGRRVQIKLEGPSAGRVRAPIIRRRLT